MSRVKAGAFSSLDIPGIALRLRASKANGGGATDGSNVLWIPDEVSGNSCRAVTGNPVINADSTLNGKPGMTFSSDEMAGLMRLHGQITMLYAVASCTNAPFVGNSGLITQNATTPTQIGITGQNGTSNIFDSYGDSWINGVNTATMSDPTAVNIFMVTDAVLSDVWTGGYVLGRYGDAGAFWNGDIIEVGAVCTTAVSTADRQQLEESLAAEYGVVL